MATSVNAQKDTTSISLGDKEMLIVKSKTRLAGKIVKLAKGIIKFEKEIAKSENVIEDAEEKLEELNEKKESAEGDKLAAIESEIKEKETVIAEEQKKIEALKKGVEDLEASIEGIENDIDVFAENELDDDLDDLDDLDELDELDDHDNLGKKKTACRKKKFNGHYSGFEFGLANFANVSKEFASAEEIGFLELDIEKSFAYSLNLFEYNIPFHKHYAGLTTGLGLDWNSFALHRNIDLSVNDDNILTATEIPLDERDYDKNRLNTAYLTIPLIFEVQFPLGKKRFYVGGGVTGSLRAWSKQKQKYYIDGEKHKYKSVDDFQLAPLKYGLTARIGYGDIGIFANYSLVEMFKPESGPELYPFSVGVRILNF